MWWQQAPDGLKFRLIDRPVAREPAIVSVRVFLKRLGTCHIGLNAPNSLHIVLDPKSQMGCQTGEGVAKHAQDCILRLRAWDMNRIVRLGRFLVLTDCIRASGCANTTCDPKPAPALFGHDSCTLNQVTVGTDASFAVVGAVQQPVRFLSYTPPPICARRVAVFAMKVRQCRFPLRAIWRHSIPRRFPISLPIFSSSAAAWLV